LSGGSLYRRVFVPGENRLLSAIFGEVGPFAMTLAALFRSLQSFG
jgi:hypothetical protein